DDARPLWAKHPQLAFDATKDLGRSAVIVVPASGGWPSGHALAMLDAGAPSHEGPRVSTRPSYLTFDVAEPFALRGMGCGEDYTVRRAGVRCPANDAIRVEFTNEIAPASFHPDKVQLEGTPLQDTQPQTNTVVLELPERPPGQTFTVVIGEGLVDIYGQPF